MNSTPRVSSQCIHCGMTIWFIHGRIWNDLSAVFPQYCPTTDQNRGEQLHEPKPDR